MPDPLSITTGLIALIQVTVTVGNEIKKFHDGASEVHTTLSELSNDVDGFTGVLESMRDTFEAITAEHGTGHIATLWDNVARSIGEGKKALSQLEVLVIEINKDTKFPDDH